MENSKRRKSASGQLTTAEAMELASRRRASAAASWRDDAECRLGNGLDNVDFSPETPSEQEFVTEICHHLCSVEAECLRDALANDERYGVLGGMTSRQRAKLQKGKST